MLSETRPIRVRPVESLNYALAWVPRHPALAGRLQVWIRLSAPNDPGENIRNGGGRVINAVVGTAREASLDHITLDGETIDVEAMKSLHQRVQMMTDIDAAIRRTLHPEEWRGERDARNEAKIAAAMGRPPRRPSASARATGRHVWKTGHSAGLRLRWSDGSTVSVEFVTIRATFREDMENGLIEFRRLTDLRAELHVEGSPDHWLDPHMPMPREQWVEIPASMDTIHGGGWWGQTRPVKILHCIGAEPGSLRLAGDHITWYRFVAPGAWPEDLWQGCVNAMRTMNAWTGFIGDVMESITSDHPEDSHDLDT